MPCFEMSGLSGAIVPLVRLDQGPSGSITLAGTNSILPSSAVMLADCADSGTHTAFVFTDLTYTVKCVHYILRSHTDSISNPCTHTMPFMTRVCCAHISIHSKKDSLTSYAVQRFKRFTLLMWPPLLTIHGCTAIPADREGGGGGGEGVQNSRSH